MLCHFPKYEEAVCHILLCNCSILNFLVYEENLIFFFISVLYCRIMPRHYCGRRNAQINVGLQTIRTGNTVNPADHQDWEYC
jgi:hypothetical protein